MFLDNGSLDLHGSSASASWRMAEENRDDP